MGKTAFELLSLPHTATPAEVKARWRELALTAHPDQGGDPEEFTALRSAYNDAYEAALLTPCPECNGTGAAHASGGFFTAQLPCPECDGGGHKY